jgi:hypothetical protein
MPAFREWRIEAKDVKSLCWRGDTLVDWVRGGTVYHLDGSVEPSRRFHAYHFDAAEVSPSGEYVVIYEKLGTKGLIRNNEQILREINRSYYFANAYEYPVTLFRLPSGREVIAHCPERYCQLEIDDLATGERLTHAPDRQPKDYFFSRLATNPGGTLLLSAGWFWRPLHFVKVYEVEMALKDPHTLDGWGLPLERRLAKDNTAALMGADKLIVANSQEIGDNIEKFVNGDEDDDEFEDDYNPKPLTASLAIYDLATYHRLSIVEPEEAVGTLMPISLDKVIGFFDHPKLIDLYTGKVLQRWPKLRTGQQMGSILRQIDLAPPLALDPANRRFAVATATTIEVVQLES